MKIIDFGAKNTGYLIKEILDKIEEKLNLDIIDLLKEEGNEAIVESGKKGFEITKAMVHLTTDSEIADIYATFLLNHTYYNNSFDYTKIDSDLEFDNKYLRSLLDIVKISLLDDEEFAMDNDIEETRLDEAIEKIMNMPREPKINFFYSCIELIFEMIIENKRNEFEDLLKTMNIFTN